MKKLVILLSIVLVAGAFAFEPKFSGTIVEGIYSSYSNQSITLPDLSGFGKSRFTISGKVNDNTSVTWIIKDVIATDYLWVDSVTTFGKLRVGTQKLGVANYGGGAYETNVFAAEVDGASLKATGLGLYLSEIYGLNINVLYSGGHKDTTGRKLAAYAKTKVANVNIGAYGIYATAAQVNSSTKSGIGLGVDADTKIGDLSIAGQLYLDSSDDSASAIRGTVVGYTSAFGAMPAAVIAKGRTIAAAYVSYPVVPGLVTGYADLVLPLSDGAKSVLGYNAVFDSPFGVSYIAKFGVQVPVNTDVQLNISDTILCPLNVGLVDNVGAINIWAAFLQINI